MKAVSLGIFLLWEYGLGNFLNPSKTCKVYEIWIGNTTFCHGTALVFLPMYTSARLATYILVPLGLQIAIHPSYTSHTELIPLQLRWKRFTVIDPKEN